MGALLVSGVLPTGRNTKIPEDGAASLRDPAVPAGQGALMNARSVLKDWLDREADRMEDGEITEPSLSVPPIEFLLWCEEEYESRAAWRRPSWLNYWNSCIGLNMQPDVPLPAPSPLVARAVELEHVASHVRFDPSDPQLTPDPKVVKSKREVYVARMAESILNESKSKTPIAQSIVDALAASDDPRRPSSVWVQLLELAQSGKYPVLRWDAEKSTIVIPRGKSGWASYTQTALQQFLRRHQGKAGLLPVAESTSRPNADGAVE